MKSRLIPIVLSLASLLASFAMAADKPEQDLKALRAQIETLKGELAENEVNRKEAADALKQSEAAISDANRVLGQLSQQQQLSHSQMQQIQADIRNTRQSLEQNRSRVVKLLETRYRNGRYEALRLILNQQDPNQVGRDLHYYRYIAAAQQQLAQQLQGQLDELNRLSEAIRQKQEELRLIASEKQRQREALSAEQAEKAQVLKRISNEITQQRGQIAKLQADEKRLTSLVEKLNRVIRQQEAKDRQAREKAEKEARKPGNKTGPVMPPPLPADGTAFAALKGKLRLPIGGTITGKFGTPSSEATVWKGVFIKAPAGQPVRAVAAGRVVFADWLRGFGNMLIVDHGGGYLSLYGAAESLLKDVGATIKAGETIATSGNSGGSAESGVYFEIRQQGKPQDPLAWAR